MFGYEQNKREVYQRHQCCHEPTFSMHVWHAGFYVRDTLTYESLNGGFLQIYSQCIYVSIIGCQLGTVRKNALLLHFSDILLTYCDDVQTKKF